MLFRPAIAAMRFWGAGPGPASPAAPGDITDRHDETATVGGGILHHERPPISMICFDFFSHHSLFRHH